MFNFSHNPCLKMELNALRMSMNAQYKRLLFIKDLVIIAWSVNTWSTVE